MSGPADPAITFATANTTVIVRYNNTMTIEVTTKDQGVVQFTGVFTGMSMPRKAVKDDEDLPFSF